MKFKITMKDPDGVSCAIQEEAEKQYKNKIGNKLVYYTPEGKERLIEGFSDILLEKIKKWFEYQEYVTIEIDTDKNTARVCENKEFN